MNEQADSIPFVAGIDFHGREVAAFDPEKVAARAQAWFGSEVAIDATDQAAVEMERVEAFLKGKPDVDPKAAEEMRTEVLMKARRNGPVYAFACTPAGSAPWVGVFSRYSVTCFLPLDASAAQREHVAAFLHSLGLGNVFELRDGEQIPL